MISKIVAFAILEVNNKNIPFICLNDLTKRSLMNYYSIQITISPEGFSSYIILNFEHKSKECILKLFNIVLYELKKLNIAPRFLENEKLDSTFFFYKLKEIKVKKTKVKQNNSLIIKSSKNLIFYDVYEINLKKIDPGIKLIVSLRNLLKDLGHLGFLIFNFNLQGKDIVINSYYINYNYQKPNENHLCKEVNGFYKIPLMHKKDSKLRLHLLIWRLPVSEIQFYYDKCISIFDEGISPNNEKTQSIYLNQLKSFLNNKFIKFKELRNNCLLIDRCILFFIFKTIDYKSILKIFRYYALEYYILLTVLNKQDYKKIMAIDKIKSLRNLQILKIGDIDEKIENINL